MNYQRLNEYRFRNIAQGRRDAVWAAVAEMLCERLLKPVLFAIFIPVYACCERFLPYCAALRHLLKARTLERGLAMGTASGMAAIAGGIASLVIWSGASFGYVPYDSVLRLVLPSAIPFVTSCQLVLGAFFLIIHGMRQSGHGLVLGVRAQHPVAVGGAGDLGGRV